MSHDNWMNSVLPPILPCLCNPSQQSLLNQSGEIITLSQDIDQDIPVENVEALMRELEQHLLNHEPNKSEIDKILALTPSDDQHIPTLDQDILAPNLDFDATIEVVDDGMIPHPITITIEREKEKMLEIANIAMEELTTLLNIDEPLWFRSMVDGKFVLQRETYDQMYLKSNCLKGPHARIESSKDSRIVNMNWKQLVDMFMNTVSTSNPS